MNLGDIMIMLVFINTIGREEGGKKKGYNIFR